MDTDTPANSSVQVELKRECPAMLIPSGMKVTLAAGTQVSITYRLGGNFTVTGPFGMARIDGADADALGEDTQAQGEKAEPSSGFPPPSTDDLWETAKTVFDPEVPVNVVDLGLVYRLELVKTDDGKNEVEADMTLTAPGCALGPMIADDLRLRLESVPGISKAQVNIVWDPPWNQDMITQEGKMILGLI